MLERNLLSLSTLKMYASDFFKMSVCLCILHCVIYKKSIRITGFMDFLHHVEFQITKKCNILETGSVPETLCSLVI
jgi:hypothetical protein